MLQRTQDLMDNKEQTENDMKRSPDESETSNYDLAYER
jgi:hypothetical protein